jgi:flagellar hook protein FlgE
MFSGVSGLRVHQTKMDVIANNISNVNTTGFKSSRVTFSEIFSQTVQGASGANPNTARGGRNPMQIGLGSNVASIDQSMTNGAAQRTDNPYDLMIQGEGFFIVSDGSGTYFTRAGAFRLDESGNLVTSSGLILNGWKAIDGTIPGTREVPKTNTRGIQISGDDEYVMPNSTSYVRLTGNLNAVTDKEKETSISFFDSLGNEYTIKARLRYDDTNKQWSVALADRATVNGDPNSVVMLNIGAGTGIASDLAGGNSVAAQLTTRAATAADSASPVTFTDAPGAVIKFTADGLPDIASGAASGSITSLQLVVDDSAGVISPPANFAPSIIVSTGELTQFSGIATASAVTVDGNVSGVLNGISIGSDGKVTGYYSNGQSKVLWQVALAQFKNPTGLERIGDNLYRATSNSGDFDGVGVEAGAGSDIMAGVLEMSNVDLAQEFTEMITTQRGFQANSRVITTSDDMLQELVNLKR